MNECMYCKRSLEEKRVSRVQEVHGRWVLIEHVPAQVRKKCGETFYTPQAHSLVLRPVRGAGESVRVEPMAVLDAS